jgi:hypothetical protein
MANTFTTNFDFIKSEVGGDNQSWGNNLHSTLELADLALSKTIEDQLISGITNSAINITAGSGTGIISTTDNLKYFESVVIGDKVRISTTNTDAANAVNGSPTIPKIYTVSAKTSANSITVSYQLVTDTSSTVTIAKVLEPVHINSGPIVCAPLQNLSDKTRAADGGTAVPGSDTTDALKANGNVTLGASDANTVTVTSKIASDLIPSTNDRDLGASGSSAWKDLHISGTATLGTVAISAGTVAGITVTTTGGSGSPGPGSVEKVVNLAVTGQSGSFTNFNMGSNGQGAKTVSSSAPSATAGYDNGDIWYEIP